MASDGITIQHLVMPSGIVDGDTPLYNRNGCDEGFPLKLRKGECIDLRAHFNLLPVGRLRSNTNLKFMLLTLRFTGSLKVHLTRYPFEGTETEIIHPSSDIAEPIDIAHGELLGIAIESVEDSIIQSGGFSCSCDDVNDVHLTHIICTYRREEALKSKLDLIASYLEEHPEMKQHYRIMVVDNGGSLEYPHENVDVIRSPNHGGSGGFARGMMESLKNDETTHVLLNDDDALLDPEVIFRTISFYSLLKGDLSDTMLGGTLLLQDDPCIVHESGASFIDGRSKPLKHNLDLSSIESNITLEDDDVIDYLGWWYMAMPVETIGEHGFPLPLFFKNDDVEYGLRTDTRKTAMCGISVWHPSLENRHSSISRYYIERNRLVLLACDRELDGGTVNRLIEKSLIDIAGLRYPVADATIRAIEDFLKGPEHVFGMHLNGIENVEEYDIGCLNSLREQMEPGKAKKAGPLFRRLTLNGIVMPSAADIETDLGNRRTEDFYRVGRVLYRIDDERGILCKRNFMRTITRSFKLIFLKRRLLHDLEELNTEYSKAREHYSSKEYWEAVFN